MKLNCIPIAQVDFWIRVRPTFIYLFPLFFRFFLLIRNSAIRLCIFGAYICMPLISFVVWPVRNKNKKLRTDFSLSAIHHAVVTGVKERKREKMHLHCIIMCTNNTHSFGSKCRIGIRAAVWKVFEYLHSCFFFCSHLRCLAGLVGCCVNRYRGYLISFQLDRH